MSAAPAIQLNGTSHPLPADSTISTLLKSLGLAEVPVLVEWNGTALFPREFPTTNLTDGDRIEIIRIVAGG